LQCPKKSAPKERHPSVAPSGHPVLQVRAWRRAVSTAHPCADETMADIVSATLRAIPPPRAATQGPNGSGLPARGSKKNNRNNRGQTTVFLSSNRGLSLITTIGLQRIQGTLLHRQGDIIQPELSIEWWLTITVEPDLDRLANERCHVICVQMIATGGIGVGEYR